MNTIFLTVSELVSNFCFPSRHCNKQLKWGGKVGEYIKEIAF